MRKNKYKNKKVLFKGIKFDSIKERNRYIYLLDLQNKGLISDLETQPNFRLLDGFKHAGQTYYPVKYLADFKYNRCGCTIIEDVKSDITRKNPTYVIKKKLFVSKYILPSEGGMVFLEVN